MVLNAPTSDEVIRQIKEVVDIPVVITVVSAHTDIRSRLAAGADFLNVSGAAATPEIVAEIRREFPEVPIIATGGPTEESILRTIRAGANAVTYTPAHQRGPVRPDHGTAPKDLVRALPPALCGKTAHGDRRR